MKSLPRLRNELRVRQKMDTTFTQHDDLDVWHKVSMFRNRKRMHELERQIEIRERKLRQ